MRGKGHDNRRRRGHHGITPAYAGKSFKIDTVSASEQDHPRLCGEKPERSRLYPCREGSPPPMRGKADHTFSFYFPPRITPAYAGKRWSRYETICIHQDHPRLCGEKTNEAITQLGVWGSPPPMRGKAEMSENRGFIVGITPAYAGKRFPFPILIF